MICDSPLKNSKGFAISEIIIAIAILSLGIVLVGGAFYLAFNTTFSVGPRVVAAYLSQDAQEIIRNLRDNNVANGNQWDAGLTGGPCSSACQADYKTLDAQELAPYDETAFLGLDSNGFYSHAIGGTPTIFKRKIIISPVVGQPDILKVSVVVDWTYQGKPFSLTTENYLYKMDN